MLRKGCQMLKTNNYSSNMFFTTAGGYINLNDVNELRRNPFTDEDGTMYALVNSPTSGNDIVIYAKVDSEIYEIPLFDEFNMLSLGVSIDTNISVYNQIMDEKIVENLIVSKWNGGTKND